jgi:phosphohistidine phosphatase
MKKLFLIRHAKSSWDDSGLRDIERPLNGRGRKDAPVMADWLAEQHSPPVALVSSPAVRARSTAGFFAKAYQLDDREVLIVNDLYEASAHDILQVVHGLEESWHNVLLFGHNPGLTDLVNEFADTYVLNLPTCGIAELHSGAKTWSNLSPANSRLVDIYCPKGIRGEEV